MLLSTLLTLSALQAVDSAANLPREARWLWHDWSGDGLLDLLALDAHGALSLWAQDRAGRFSDVTELAGLGGLHLHAAAFVDLDGDGRDDLALLSAEGALALYLQPDAGRFLPIDAPALGDGYTSLAALDADGDGRPDLHLAGARGHVLLRQTGDGGLEPSVLAAASFATGSLQSAAPTAGSAPSNLAPPVATQAQGSASFVCVGSIDDLASGACLEASSVPQLGRLYPLSQALFVAPSGAVGLGTTTPGPRLDVAGVARAQQFISTAVTGTPPFTISSRSVVPLLNADLIDGLDSTAFRAVATLLTTADLEDAAVTGPKLADAAVTAAKLADGAVDATKLAQGAVDSAALAPGAVTATKLAQGAVGVAALADLAVTTDKLDFGAVQSDNLADGSVTATKLAPGAVGAGTLGTGSVTSAAIVDGAVTEADLAAASVSSAKLQPASVGTLQILDGSVQGVDLAPGAVGTAALATGAVTGDRIALGAVGTSELAAGAVTTDRIQGGAVTADRIAAGAVTTDRIAAGAVNLARIGLNAVDSARIVDGSVGAADLAVGAVTSASILNGTITGADLADGSVGAAALAPGAVDSSAIADGAVRDADISPSAAIQGTKVRPEFGAQTVRSLAGAEFGAPQGDRVELGAVGAPLRAVSNGLAGDFTGRVAIDAASPALPALDVEHVAGGSAARVALADPTGTSSAPALHVVATGNGAARGVLVESLGLGNMGAAFQVVHSGAGVGLDITSGALPLRLDRTINAGTLIEARNSLDIEFRVDSSGDVFCDGAFIGGGADYAEWLALADPNEEVRPGDVVAVRDGLVGKGLAGAQRWMVVSPTPVFIATHAGAEDAGRPGHAVVAFVGRAPVRVLGRVAAGDLLVASGRGDGTAVAVAPAAVTAAHLVIAVGTAWASADGDGPHLVEALVGVGAERVAALALARLEREARERDALLQRLAARIEALERR